MAHRQKNSRLTSDIRRKANDAMLQDFFKSYDPFWRLTKLLSIKTVLENRELLKTQLEQFHQSDPNFSGDGYVFGPATNGLVFSAVSELVMGCEDFFLLFKGIRETQFFIRNTVTYSAGTVTSLIPGVSKFDDAKILKSLMIPPLAYVQNLLEAANLSEIDQADALGKYESACAVAIAYVRDVAGAYERFQTLYNQYKHGLTVGLRPFGNEPNDEMIEELKNNLGGNLVFYDNNSIEVAFKKGDLQGGVAFYMDPATQPYIMELIEERNFLRSAFANFVEIAELIEVARKLAVLSMCIIENRLDFINPQQAGANTVHIPTNNSGSPLERIAIGLQASKLLQIEDFT